MQSIEVTGKSVDEAKKSAAAKLGVAVEELTVTVLEETKGLFGKSNVRIRAEVVPAAPNAAVVEVPAPKTPEPAPEPVSEAAKPEPEAEKPKRSRRGKAEQKAEAEPAEEAPAEEFAEEASSQGPSATDQDAAQLAALVREMLDSADMDVKIKSTTANGRYVNIELDGRDVAHLVGKHGEVLNAMQYLVNIVAGRKFNNGIRATLDGNNYRHRREEALYQLATRVADEVLNRGEEAVLDALPAFERRIIHKSLADYKGIQTYSEGEEPNRRVVIAPAD
ncbi:MAG TPA: RNA-binding cell elongation regulator Jag/EloR [Fimbriimonadaceae bacterium]|nr:RNA-binding cell elongation regulator Jag/EloR [Fimbriimonadaceae bacterium]